MGTALVGIAGVIVGGVVTGGVQVVLGSHARKLESRTAARLLFVALLEARIAMEAAKDFSGWQPPSLDWGQFGYAWAEHRSALARALGTVDFITASFAFSRIAHIATIRADHRDPLPPGVAGWNFTPVIPIIDQYLPFLKAAEQVVWQAAFTGVEKARKRMPTPPASP